MTPALIASFAAILALALATPRQAGQWLGRHSNARTRRALRRCGFAGLGISFLLSPGEDAHARAIITWVGALAIQAIAAALLLQPREKAAPKRR